MTAPTRTPELAWVLAAALAIGLAVALWPAAERWAPLLDAQLRAAAPAEPPAGVLVIDIDDASLAELKSRLGPWPFKRDTYALVVEELRTLGARAIAIDLLLADAHPGDAALARAIERPGAPVVLAAAGLEHASDDAPVRGAVVGGTVASRGTHWTAMTLPSDSLWPAPGTLPQWVGVITTPRDTDGRLRRLPLLHNAHGREWPAFPLAVLQAVGGALALDAPLDPAARVTIPFPVAARADARTMPFARVARAALGGPADAELAAAVRGAVVFIGSSALLADNVLTPGGQWRGTAVLAHAYAALRDGRVARPAPAWSAAVLLALALLPAAWAWRRARVRPLTDGLAALGVLVVLVAVGWVAAARYLTFIPLAAPLAALASSVGLGLAAHLRASARHERELAYEGALASAANRAKSEFLANVSHEIRTPMNAVMGVAELLARTPLTPEQRRHVQVLQRSGHTLLELIDDLLDLAKIEAGRFDLDDTPFALREALLEPLVALLAPRAQAKGIALALDIAPDLPAGLRGDPRRLAQTLTNLVGNAIKFTAQGEVRLTVAREADGQLAFTVSDTGIGIAASKLDAIFEPFMQADGSVTRQFGGTGLGLAISKRLVQAMGGSIHVQSAPGQGSLFRVRVPLQEAEVPTATQDDRTPPPAPRGLSVLLAEDNDINVYLFKAMLDGLDARIEHTADGLDAVERFRRGQHDIVFLDVQMPVLDGHQAARAMRAIEASQQRRRTPIVALTAHAYAEDARASLAAGCDAHLSKPLARTELIAEIARLCGAVAQAQPAVPRPAVSSPTGAADAGVIDTAAALARLDGNELLYRKVCEHARVFFSTWSAAFDSACLSGDAAQARLLAHDLKGIALTVGANTLSEAAAALEAQLIPLSSLPADRAPIERAADALRPLIGQTLQVLGSPPRSPL